MKSCKKRKKVFSMFKLLSAAMAVAIILTGCTGTPGADGRDGVDGKDGKDGKTPTITINSDGYWVINGEVTTYKAVASDGKNGVNGKNGKDGVNGKDGKDGETPTITINKEGYWVINGEVTNIKAKGNDGKTGADGKDGKDGEDGQNGTTPTIEINEEGYWVINGVVTEYKATVNNYVDEEIKYEIGQTVKFNPGDGEKVWNVIDEDKETVTLMLSENLGTTVSWYEDSIDTNYGPKDALEYLNSLTINWNNVDQIKSFTYENNQNGTALPNGYQKIEIEDGHTRLTHKNGITVTEVAGISKARILTREEVFELAQKTNENLKEYKLREFISDNLGILNDVLAAEDASIQLSSVDEAIALAVQLEPALQYESKYMQTYNTVYGLIYEVGINSTYDILLPDYLYQKLYSDHAPFAYWTLSSHASDSSDAWYVRYSGHVYDNHVNNTINYGVRPVITISKSLSLEIVE